jgi:hypothetical protein
MPFTILLPKGSNYEIGQPIPIFSVPTKLENPNSGTFDDFQWWSYAEDFDKWLKAHPRDWTADSEDVSKKYSSFDELMEAFSVRYNISYENGAFKEADIVKSFESFLNERESDKIFEDDQPKTQNSTNVDRAKQQIKLTYAYNQLLNDGKLQKFSTNELKEGAFKAVFTALRDDNDKAIMQSLTAFKMTGFGSDSDKAKIKLIEVLEARPLGIMDDNTTAESLSKGMLLSIGAVGGFCAGALALGSASIMKGFEIVEGVRALKAIKGFLPGAKAGVEVAKDVKNTGWVSKVLSGGATKLKGLYGLFSFKNSLLAGKVVARGIGGAYKAAKYGGNAATVAKAFTTGLTRGSTAAASAGFELIPFVGEVLIAAQIIGSVYNWNSSKQAPSYNEIKDEGFARNEFDPKNIGVGRLITLCWSQPPGSWGGTAVSFFWDNDTRTTATLLKIANTAEESIFVLVDIHSAQVSKQLKEHDLIMLSVSNSEVYNDHSGFISATRRLMDAEDIDYKIAFVDGMSKMASVFDFEGMCEWNDFITYYDKASDQYLGTDDKAPDEYLFYYKDQNGDHINVSGRLIKNDKFDGISDSDFEAIFNPTDARKKDFGIKDRPTKESIDFDDAIYTLVNESKNSGSGIITSFSDFQNGITKLSAISEDEEESEKTEDKPAEAPAETEAKPAETEEKPAETTDKPDVEDPENDSPEETDSSNSDVTPPDKNLSGGSNKLMTGPKLVAVYAVVNREYANPELRKYTPGVFQNFFIDPADYGAKSGQRINPEVNSVYETIDSPRAGVYTYKKKKDEGNGGSNVDTTNPNKGGGSNNGNSKNNGDNDSDDRSLDRKDDYYINVDPDDVSIKNRKNATIITDHNKEGGINIEDKFLTDREKEILGISQWKSVTTAKTVLNDDGKITKVKIKNANAEFGERNKVYKVTDGEAFQVACKFAKEIEDRLRYQ